MLAVYFYILLAFSTLTLPKISLQLGIHIRIAFTKIFIKCVK